MPKCMCIASTSCITKNQLPLASPKTTAAAVTTTAAPASTTPALCPPGYFYMGPRSLARRGLLSCTRGCRVESRGKYCSRCVCPVTTKPATTTTPCPPGFIYWGPGGSRRSLFSCMPGCRGEDRGEFSSRCICPTTADPATTTPSTPGKFKHPCCHHINKQFPRY